MKTKLFSPTRFFSDHELVKQIVFSPTRFFFGSRVGENIFFTNSFFSDREIAIFAGSRFSNHVACENRESCGGGGAFTWKTITSAIALGIFGPIYHLACRNKSRALPRMGGGGAMLKNVASATAGGAEGLTRWKTIAIGIALGTLGPVPS